VLQKELSAILDVIVKQVEATNAGIVVVDSFRTAVRKQAATAEMDIQFLFNSWRCI
jgi:circadian clock protein KaiC